MLYVCHGVLHSSEMGYCCSQQPECIFANYNVEQKKPDTKDSILNDFIYMKDKHRQNKCRMIEIREWLPLGWGKLDRKQMREFLGLIEIHYILFLVVVAQTVLTILK